MRLNDGSAPLTPVELLQLGLTVLCIFLAFTRPWLAAGWCLRLEDRLRRLNRRPWLCAIIVGLLPVCARLVLLPLWPAPTPYVHDEFAYLLQADTFASGRITNAAPPVPQHFESVYILVSPTYTAEYQPGQALVLSLGEKLTGCPWAGVVLSMGVLSGLLYWALYAWVAPTWAFVGAGLFGIEIGVLSYWMNSYWGGTVPAIGGTLVFGGLARLRAGSTLLHSFLTGLGLLILLCSRPLEGALLCLLSLGAVLYWLATRQLNGRLILTRVAPPAAIVFGVGLAVMGSYNYRVTHRPLEFPYLLYRRLYGMPQGFIWQKPVRATTTMPVDTEAVYRMQLRQREQFHSIVGALRGTARKIRRVWEFYVGVPLLVTLLFAGSIWRDRNMRLTLAGILLVLCLDNLTFFEYYPHYSAAVAVLLLIVVVQCLRRMRHSGEAGLFLSRALPAVCVLGLLVPVCGRALEPAFGLDDTFIAKLWHREFWYPSPRALILKWLEYQPGRDLVFVRYEPFADHIPGDASLELQRQREDAGWVYNSANPSAQKVLWARDISPTSNRELARYFPGRRTWIVNVDQFPEILQAYTPLENIPGASNGSAFKPPSKTVQGLRGTASDHSAPPE